MIRGIRTMYKRPTSILEDYLEPWYYLHRNNKEIDSTMYTYNPADEIKKLKEELEEIKKENKKITEELYKYKDKYSPKIRIDFNSDNTCDINLNDEKIGTIKHKLTDRKIDVRDIYIDMCNQLRDYLLSEDLQYEDSD